MSACVIQRPKTVSTRRPLPRRSNVLIVDDDAILRELLSRRLQKQGFDTLMADSGQQGLEAARNRRPDVILLDLRLPDRDGLEVCAQLADARETCFIPVIVLTGLDDPNIIRRSRAAGCHYFLHKPFDPNVLLTLIRQALDDVCDGSVA
ncbi:MAG: response regulator [Pirellulales bacterium]|nr:response regulator [Pirellulales bacterium]